MSFSKLPELIAAHEKVALQFSGGKDSLACLYLLEPWWHKTWIVWVNTGAAYPETLAQMATVRKTVPHWIEVFTDQPRGIAQHGLPADIVPIAATDFAVSMGSTPRVRLQTWVSCCHRHIWQPLEQATLETGATLIVRGQKKSDRMRSPVRDGDVLSGLTYCLPLQEWSDKDVLDFLRDRGIELPAAYAWADTSLDCWSCTAFITERQRELEHLPARYPEKWGEVRRRLRLIHDTVNDEQATLREIIRNA